MSKTTYYDLLGVKKFAGIQDIQTAYRKAVKLVHPDVAVDLPPEILESGIYHTIKEAYEVLGDPVSKARYDAGLRKETLKRILFRPGLLLAAILAYWYVKSPPAIPSRFPLHYTDGTFRVPSASEWSSWLLASKGSVFWHFLWSQHKILVLVYIFAGVFVSVVALVYAVYCLRAARKTIAFVSQKIPDTGLFRRERLLALPEAKRGLVERILKAAVKKNSELEGR